MKNRASSALSTLGYGNRPTSWAAQLISSIGSFCGVGLMLLPASIFAAGFIRELDRDKQRQMIRRARRRSVHVSAQHHNDDDDDHDNQPDNSADLEEEE